MHRHEQAMHMEDGQGMDEYVARLPAPQCVQCLCVGAEVAVRQLRTFAAAGGTAGVEDGRDSVG